MREERKPVTKKLPKRPLMKNPVHLSEDEADLLVSDRESATQKRYSLEEVLQEHGYTVER